MTERIETIAAFVKSASERKKLDEALRRTNPLQITCVECWNVCVLSKDGKRWLCQYGHGNERIEEQASVTAGT